MRQIESYPVPHEHEYIIGQTARQILFTDWTPIMVGFTDFEVSNCGAIARALYFNDTLVTDSTAPVFREDNSTTFSCYSDDITLIGKSAEYEIHAYFVEYQ